MILDLLQHTSKTHPAPKKHLVVITVSLLLLQISDIGGLAVGDALKQTLCLQRLNLNHNMLSSSTLSSIADAVSVNPGTL